MRPPPPDGALDLGLQRLFGRVAGVDEVGRGALAGPLTVAAVVLDPSAPISGLDDSKRLTFARRVVLADAIRHRAAAWAVCHVSVDEVDRLNVLEATRMAMREASRRLHPFPDCVVSDAVPFEIGVPVLAEPAADGRYLCVAAASILAKVARDTLMGELSLWYPGYGWESNRGYGTKVHCEALRRFGLTPLHRRSFAPARVLA